MRFPAAHLCLVATIALLSGISPDHARAEEPASVTVPSEVGVGSQLEVRWTGPAAKGDFVSIDPDGAPDRQYGQYEYTRNGSPVTLKAPGTPGTYLVRYHSGGSGYPVLASAKLTVVAVTATIEAPPTAGAGAEISVSWSGPNNQGDFISIDPADAPEREYGAYVYTNRGSPATLMVPGAAGRYEVRYHLGTSGYPVIGTAPVLVGDVVATLEAPATAPAGSSVEVHWKGPDNPRDFVSIDPIDAPSSKYGRYVYTSKGSPVTLPVPDQPGRYVIRYHLGASGYKAIGASVIEATATSATVAPAANIVAGEAFEVEWTGPNHERDFITITEIGAPDRDYGNYAYTRRGSPARLEAPKKPGRYEVRYATGASYTSLARAEVEVRPSSARGTLRVVSDASAATSTAQLGAVEVILDASGSMLQRLDGKRRIELAREALLALTESTLPPGTPFALRVFGHREAESCRTDLEIGLAPLNRSQVAAAIRTLEAKNLAKTPIADSLRRVKQDLAGATGPKIVVLITDGEETCGGDPAAAIRELAAAGIEVTVNVVGFAIDELAVKEEFEAWARLGGGRYVDASDGTSLENAIVGAVSTAFEVLRGGQVVASGAVGGIAIELPPGSYEVRVKGGGKIGTATVSADQEAVVKVPR